MEYHYHARLTVRGREIPCRAVVEGRLGLCGAAGERRFSARDMQLRSTCCIRSVAAHQPAQVLMATTC